MGTWAERASFLLLGPLDESAGEGKEQAGGEDVLAMQLVLFVPAGKGARDIDALARPLPLNQGGDRGPAGVWALELVAQVVVVGGGGAEHGRAPREGALDLILVNGRGEVVGGEDGRAGGVDLLLDGQRQARRAAEVRRGHNVVLRGLGGVERGHGLAGGGRHIDRAGLRRGRGRGRRCGRGGGPGRGLEERRRRLGRALGGALLVAHGGEGVVGGAQLAGDGGRGAGSNRLRAAARVRARRRRLALCVLEARRRGRGLRFALGLDAQCLDRLSSPRRVVRVRDVKALMVRGAM